MLCPKCGRRMLPYQITEHAKGLDVISSACPKCEPEHFSDNPRAVSFATARAAGIESPEDEVTKVLKVLPADPGVQMAALGYLNGFRVRCLLIAKSGLTPEEKASMVVLQRLDLLNRLRELYTDGGGL